MITRKKVEIYQHFSGDRDGWSRARHGDQMDDGDWPLIASLLQDIRIAKNGLGSIAFKAAVEEKLRAVCENDQTINALIALSENNVY